MIVLHHLPLQHGQRNDSYNYQKNGKLFTIGGLDFLLVHPLSSYSQPHNTSNPDHRPSSSHQQPPGLPSSSNAIQSSSSGSSEVPKDSTVNDCLGEQISLAPASPILSLSSTSSNHSQSSKSHLVQSAERNLLTLPSPISCSELSGDEEIDIIGPPSPFRSTPIVPEQHETNEMYIYLTW